MGYPVERVDDCHVDYAVIVCEAFRDRDFSEL